MTGIIGNTDLLAETELLEEVAARHPFGEYALPIRCVELLRDEKGPRIDLDSADKVIRRLPSLMLCRSYIITEALANGSILKKSNPMKKRILVIVEAAFSLTGKSALRTIRALLRVTYGLQR